MQTGGFGTYISTATTTTIKGKGELVRIILGETAAATITIKDGATTKCVLKASVAEGVYDFGMKYKGNLVIVTAGASKLTVITK